MATLHHYIVKLKLVILIAFFASLLSGCAAKVISITGTYPSPLIEKLPISLGVYYDPEFANFSYIEINDDNGKDQYIINSGESQLALFNTILPSVFAKVTVIDNLDEVENNNEIDIVFVPMIEEFQVGLPSKTRLDVYEVWLKYNMRLSTKEGQYIADWVMTAYGKSPTESFQQVGKGVNEAAIVALRDLAASFSLGFSDIPEINEWLQSENIL